jgi:beta-lactamase family protein
LPNSSQWPDGPPRRSRGAQPAPPHPRPGSYDRGGGYAPPGSGAQRAPGQRGGAPRGRPTGDLLSGRQRPIRSHGRRRRSPLLALIFLLFGAAALGAGLRYLPGAPFAPAGAVGPEGGASATPTVPPAPPPLPFRQAVVTAASVGTTGFLSWALLDRRSGEIVGSPNLASPSTTMSMIKAWLAADYLRLGELDKKAATPEDRLPDLQIMIRDSDNAAAQRTYNAVGGTASIKRMITMCGLTDSKPAPAGKGFGYTSMSAQDAVRMGECVGSGRAAGDRWTPTLLDWMRTVRRGDFGAREALPEQMQADVAIKNGWDWWHEDNTYRTNCLAVGDTWVMAIMLRYPFSGNEDRDLAHNSQICAEVAHQLLNPDFIPPSATPEP